MLSMWTGPLGKDTDLSKEQEVSELFSSRYHVARMLAKTSNPLIFTRARMESKKYSEW